MHVIINQSIHINLSAAQNITGAYIIIMLVCRRLLTTRLPRKAADLSTSSEGWL